MADLQDLAVVSIPLAAGTIVYLLWLWGGWAARRAAGVASALAGAARLIAAAACAWTFGEAWLLFSKAPAGGMFWQVGEPIDLGPVSLVLALRADGLSTLIVLAAAGIALLVVLYSLRAMADHPRQPVFYAMVLWTLGAASAAALANTFLVLLVAWEAVTVLLYLLISMGRAGARAGAMKTFAILGLADLGLLMGVAILLGTGAVGKDLLLAVPPAGPEAAAGGLIGTGAAAATVAYLLILAAALAKTGAMPLHTWIPAASEDAPTPAFALLPAALDKLLGIYLLARITFGVFAVGGTLATVLMILGAVTILCAVMMAMIQHNLKRLLAFHAVSQAGYMVLGMGVAASVLAAGRAAGGLTADQAAVAAIAFAGGLFHMLNNAIYKCGLFLMAGAAERVAGTAELDRLGGLARMLPVTFASAVVASLAISGVPPMNGFVSKWLVYHGALGEGSAVGLVCLVAAVFGSALTLASFIKVLHSVFLGTRGAAVPADGRSRESLTMAAPMVALAVACLVLGIGGGWAVGRLILPAALAVGIEPAGIQASDWTLVLREGRGLWSPSTATGLIAVGVVLGLVVYVAGRAMRVRVVPNFAAGEDTSSDAQWHVSGTHFYETIRRLPLLSGVFGDASAGAFDLYRLTGQYGRTVVERLRAWHTGLLAVYASWVLLGLVVLAVVLALR